MAKPKAKTMLSIVAAPDPKTIEPADRQVDVALEQLDRIYEHLARVREARGCEDDARGYEGSCSLCRRWALIRDAALDIFK